jgi:hypothetical protein
MFSATGLPPGITINISTGVILGTPTTADAAGTATITVTDSLSATASITIAYGVIAAAPVPLTFTDSSAYDIPASTVGTAIANINVSGGASGGATPYTFSATGLPAGITISAVGVISGAPTTAGAAGTATITVTDNLGATANITIAYGVISSASSTTFTITANAGAYGSISPFGLVHVNSGANQRFSIVPNPYYSIGAVYVDGINVGAVSSYTFTNVTANHTISAAFYYRYSGGYYGYYGSSSSDVDYPQTTPKPPASAQTPFPSSVNAYQMNPFIDVFEHNWFYGSVMYIYTHGLMNGTDPNAFNPGMNLTRGMFAAILFRHAGEPQVNSANPFFDVSGDQYYADAVRWAAANRIVSGIGDGLYAPNAPISRQDLAVLLNNYAKAIGAQLPATRSYNGFIDEANVANYAKEAIATFFRAGIISGRPGNLFDPKGTATRAEVAAMLQRFLEAI